MKNVNVVGAFLTSLMLALVLGLQACGESTDAVYCKSYVNYVKIKSADRDTIRVVFVVGKDTSRFLLKSDTVVRVGSSKWELNTSPDQKLDTSSWGNLLYAWAFFGDIDPQSCNQNDTLTLTPKKVKIPSSAKIWVYDLESFKIKSWSLDSVSLTSPAKTPTVLMSGLVVSKSMVFDGFGNLWIAHDDVLDQLSATSLGDSLARKTFSMKLVETGAVSSMVFDRWGNLFLVDSLKNRIQGYRYSSIEDNGVDTLKIIAPYTTVSGLNKPVAALFDSSSVLWALEQSGTLKLFKESKDSVEIWSAQHAYVFKWQDSLLQGMTSIFVDGQKLFLGYGLGSRLAWVELGALTQDTVSVQGVLDLTALGRSYSITMDSRGQLWLPGLKGALLRLLWSGDSLLPGVLNQNASLGGQGQLLVYPSAKNAWIWDTYLK